MRQATVSWCSIRCTVVMSNCFASSLMEKLRSLFPGPATMLRNVRKLQPGHSVTISGISTGNISVSEDTFYQIPYDPDNYKLLLLHIIYNSFLSLPPWSWINSTLTSKVPGRAFSTSLVGSCFQRIDTLRLERGFLASRQQHTQQKID